MQIESLNEYKNKKIKEYLEEKQYEKCIDLIEQEIINYVVNLIRKKDKDYKYTSMIDLMVDSENLLENENKEIARKIRFYNEENDLIKLERLLSLCEIYNIKF